MTQVIDKRKIGRSEDVTSADSPAPQMEDAKDSAKVTLEPAADPVEVLLNKVQAFLLEQAEYFFILSLPRTTRKTLERGIVKRMTRVPHLQKVNNADMG